MSTAGHLRHQLTRPAWVLTPFVLVLWHWFATTVLFGDPPWTGADWAGMTATYLIGWLVATFVLALLRARQERAEGRRARPTA